jgi:hypothetical protein
LTRATHHTAQAVLQSEAPNWVFSYDTKPGKWTQILPSRPTTAGMEIEAPQPRYAHQVVYDPGRKMAFLHGGNAGIAGYRRTMGRRDEYEEGGDGDVNMEEEDEEDKSEKEKEGEEEKESRLDDFWCFTLKRWATLFH